MVNWGHTVLSMYVLPFYFTSICFMMEKYWIFVTWLLENVFDTSRSLNIINIFGWNCFILIVDDPFYLLTPIVHCYTKKYFQWWLPYLPESPSNCFLSKISLVLLIYIRLFFIIYIYLRKTLTQYFLLLNTIIM